MLKVVEALEARWVASPRNAAVTTYELGINLFGVVHRMLPWTGRPVHQVTPRALTVMTPVAVEGETTTMKVVDFPYGVEWFTGRTDTLVGEVPEFWPTVMRDPAPLVLWSIRSTPIVVG